MNIRDVMTPNPRTLSPEDSIQNAARIMRDEDTGAVPVVENGRVLGMVTDRDIVIRLVAEGGDASSAKVRDAMSERLTTIDPDQDLDEAMRLMADHQVRRLPVCEEDGRLVGMLSLGDVALGSASMRGVGEALASISTSVATADVNAGPDLGTPDRVLANREAS